MFTGVRAQWRVRGILAGVVTMLLLTLPVSQADEIEKFLFLS